MRPGQQYLLVGANTETPPELPWCSRSATDVQAVQAYELSVPAQVSEREEAALLASGVSVVSHVAIRPVGLVASGWDGEGEVEWLAGEPAILGFRSDLMPRRCRVILDGSPYFLDWPSEDPDLLFCMEGLAVGTRELAVTLLGEDDRQLATGLLTITIRDPQVRPEGASVGEGIRMLAMPAHPTLGELWDQRAVVTVDGPQGSDAELTVTLSDDADSPLAIVSRSIRLPLSEGSWKVLAKSIRDDRRFGGAYDEAESCTINITRAEVGYATLNCDRGFRPLRWRFSRSHDGTVTATLVDRTDSGNTTVDFYDVEKPLMAVRHDTRRTTRSAASRRSCHRTCGRRNRRFHSSHTPKRPSQNASGKTRSQIRELAQ